MSKVRNNKDMHGVSAVVAMHTFVEKVPASLLHACVDLFPRASGDVEHSGGEEGLQHILQGNIG